MIKVYQNLTVHNDGTGNCRNACIASLLERPLREVADILPTDPGDWRERWNHWLASQGYKLSLFIASDRRDPPSGYAIASVYTDRVYPETHRNAGKPISHAVIVFNGQLVHDPFPLGSNITSTICYEVLTPLTDAEKRIFEIKNTLPDDD